MIKKLLVKDPKQRLGSINHNQIDYQLIKRHLLFQNVDFEKILQLKPPIENYNVLLSEKEDFKKSNAKCQKSEGKEEKEDNDINLHDYEKTKSYSNTKEIEKKKEDLFVIFEGKKYLYL